MGQEEKIHHIFFLLTVTTATSVVTLCQKPFINQKALQGGREKGKSKHGNTSSPHLNT